MSSNKALYILLILSNNLNSYAPDIRWSALSQGHHEGEQHVEEENPEHHDEYTFQDFKNAVVYGKHPDCDQLNQDMPRWQMSDADLRVLMEYLKSL